MGFSRVFANPASKAHGNPNSLSLNCHVLLVGENPQAPWCKTLSGFCTLKPSLRSVYTAMLALAEKKKP